MSSFEYSSYAHVGVLTCATLACLLTLPSSPFMKQRLQRHLLPNDILNWKNYSSQGSEYKAIWGELQPLLERHGFRLWRVTFGGYVQDESYPTYPNSIFLTPQKVQNISLKNWCRFLGDNSLSHAARRSHDSQDVVLRVVTAGGEGQTHLKIIRRLTAPPDILMSNNHILPILHEIVYEDITIVAVPKIGFDLNPVICSVSGNSLEDVLYMMVQLFEGMAYLHRNLIAHRDLFLSNVMVEWMPQFFIERSSVTRPRVYIIDFETAVDFSPDSTDRKCSDTPFVLSKYGRPVAPELSKGEPYCPFKLDMWQAAIDLQKRYHTGLIEIDTLWANLTAASHEDRPTADKAMRTLDAFLRKTPPLDLHRPGSYKDYNTECQKPEST